MKIDTVRVPILSESCQNSRVVKLDFLELGSCWNGPNRMKRERGLTYVLSLFNFFCWHIFFCVFVHSEGLNKFQMKLRGTVSVFVVFPVENN